MVGSMIVQYALGIAAGTALTFGQAAVAFAINFAVSSIVTRVFADNPEKQQDMGVREQVPPSGVNAIPVVYGSAYMGGTFVDAVLANLQRKMYYVLAVSSISPNGQFTFDQSDMWFGDQKIVFDSGEGSEPGKVVALIDQADNENTKVSGNLFIYLFTSNEAGVITPINSSGSLPSDIMGGTDIDVAQRWPSSGRQMNGLAFAIVVMNYNQEANTTSLSPITFHVSHTLNSTGVAKPGDVWYDYMTSKTYGGAVGWMPDGTFDSSFVDAASATALNTYSDELITFDDYDGNPQTQARYRINGVLDAGQSVLSNIDRIMSSCDSWMTYNAAAGQWSVVVNKAETTAYAFDDDNIIGEIRVSATDITSSINQVEARFPFKEKRDQAAFVNIETPYALLYPNEPVNKYSITYDLVNDSVQAHYLANRLLEQAREDLIVSFSTTYYGIQVNAGDVVSVTNADYGWNAKLFRVMKVNEASLPDGSLGAKLEMNEYSAAVYDNQDITQYSPVPNSNLPSATYFSPLAAPTVTGYPTASIPHFDVQVYVPATGRVTYGNLFYTTSATPSSSDWQLLTTASTASSTPVTNATYYTFANQSLPSGTYYFAYVVGNDVSQSILSPASASFAWSPTGMVGPTGPSGLNSATIYLYNKNTSTTPPALFSGTFTYTFATGVLSGGTLNGWSQTPPSVAAGEFLFLSLATASSTAATDSIPYTEFSTPEVISGTGTNGANTAIVTLYNKNTSTSTPPTAPSGTFTYTFATAALSGGTLNGWTQSQQALVAGEYQWAKQATAYSTAATDTIAATEFSSAVIVGGVGTNGATGGAGAIGLAAITAYKVQSQSTAQPTFTTPTSGSAAPTGWYLTLAAALSAAGLSSLTPGYVVWYLQGQYNANAFTSGGVPASSTAWTGPVAASVFQDLKSDNWNGDTPPTYGSPSTYGTVGYYIRQGNTSGSPSAIYINEGIFSGDISTDGDATFKGKNPATQTIIVGGVVYGIDYTTYAQAITQPALNTARVGHFGYAAAQSNAGVGYITYNVGLLGNGKNVFGSKGIGVVGEGDQTGGYFNGTEYGVIANSNGITPVSLAVTSGTYFQWGLYNIANPGGTTTKFLRDDGTWAIPSGGSGGGTVTSVSGTGTVSGLTLSGTVTTSGSLTLGGTLSLTSSNVTTALGYTPYNATNPNGYTSNTGTVTSVSGTGTVSGLSLSGSVTTSGSLSLGGTLSVTQANLIASAPGTAYYLSGSGWTSTTAVMSLAGTNSGTATVSGNTLNILGSTGTGIAGAYVGTTGSGNTVTLDIRTTSPSDMRLKHEVEDIDLGLAFVNKLRPVSYKLIADPRQQKGYGLIADEVEQETETGTSLVYFEPDWKVGEETGFKTIHYPSYVAVLIKAVQELTAKVEALEAQLKG